MPRDQIEYYLAYSTYICELAEKHPWDLVLDFDFRYRERQAQLQFPWGSRVSSLDLALLSGSNHRGQARTDTPPAPAPNRKKQLCHDFKANGYCEFGNKCRYKHWTPRPRPDIAPRFDNRPAHTDTRPPATAPPAAPAAGGRAGAGSTWAPPTSH